jgi:hypothetical protein
VPSDEKPPQDRPPFDHARAAFLLIAFVIGIHAVIILGHAAACLVYARELITQTNPDIKCDPDNKLLQLLAAALAAALAFAGVGKGK